MEIEISTWLNEGVLSKPHFWIIDRAFPSFILPEDYKGGHLKVQPGPPGVDSDTIDFRRCHQFWLFSEGETAAMGWSSKLNDQGPLEQYRHRGVDSISYDGPLLFLPPLPPEPRTFLRRVLDKLART